MECNIDTFLKKIPLSCCPFLAFVLVFFVNGMYAIILCKLLCITLNAHIILLARVRGHTKTNAKCFKDRMYVIFLKSREFKDFKYDMDMDNGGVTNRWK